MACTARATAWSSRGASAPASNRRSDAVSARAVMKSLVSSSIVAAAVLAVSGVAHAQGLGPNADGPIDITADELEVQNKACVSVWRGKAEMLQGETRLRADLLRAVMATKPGA